MHRRVSIKLRVIYYGEKYCIHNIIAISLNMYVYTAPDLTQDVAYKGSHSYSNAVSDGKTLCKCYV